MATSTFFTSFKTGPGAKLEGYSGHIYLVPSGSAVNGDMPLTEDTGRGGQYFRENVPDGEYKVYVDMDKSGSPVEGDLYKTPGGNAYLVWHGEKKVSIMSQYFDANGKQLPTGMATQTKTLSSITEYPDYIGQSGKFNGEHYEAVSTSTFPRWIKKQLKNYPLKPDATGVSSFSTFSVETFNRGIIDIYLTGTRNPAKQYAIGMIQRNVSGGWQIQIYDNDLYNIVAFFQTSKSPENGNEITIHRLIALGGSGISGEIAIKWSEFTSGFNGYGHKPSLYPLLDEVWDLRNTKFLNYTKQIYTNNPIGLGAKMDGLSHPLSDYFGTLGEAQVFYPHADSLTNELDWAVLQKMINEQYEKIELSANAIYYGGNKTLDIGYQNSGLKIFGNGAKMYTNFQIPIIYAHGLNMTTERLERITIKEIDFIFTREVSSDPGSIFSYAGTLADDDYTGNKNSIAIKTQLLYTAKIEGCKFRNFGYGILLWNESAQFTIIDNYFNNNVMAICGAQDQICNALNIESNSINFNVGMAIYVDTGANINIFGNDIEGNSFPIDTFGFTDAIQCRDSKSNLIKTPMYFRVCRRVNIRNNYFEGNPRWWDPTSSYVAGQYSQGHEIVTLNSISKGNIRFAENYSDIWDMNTNNADMEKILGTTILPDPLKVNISSNNMTNDEGDNLIINPEFKGNWGIGSALKTTGYGEGTGLFNAATIGFTYNLADDAIFNGFNVLSFINENAPLKVVQLASYFPGVFKEKEMTAYFGTWVKSPRIGTVGMQVLFPGDGTIYEGKETISQLNMKENEWQFVTGFRPCDLSGYTDMPVTQMVFIAPRFKVTDMERIDATTLQIKTGYNNAPLGYIKIGDTVTFDTGVTGLISSISADSVNQKTVITLAGIYSELLIAITSGYVSTFAEGAITLNFKCPQFVLNGSLQPATPQRMQKTSIEKYSLDASGTISFTEPKRLLKRMRFVSHALAGGTFSLSIDDPAISTEYTIPASANSTGDIACPDLNVVINSDSIITYTGVPVGSKSELLLTWYEPDLL